MEMEEPNPSSRILSDLSPMDCTVGGGDLPTDSIALCPPPLSLPPIEALSASSMSPPGILPAPVFNDATRGSSSYVEAPPLTRRKKKCLECYEEFFAERERRILAFNEKRDHFIEKLRKGTLEPHLIKRPRLPPATATPEEPPAKSHPLFQCGQGHRTCIECYEHHSKKCRYCLTTQGLIVYFTKENAAQSTNQYSCHQGRGWVIPKEDDFFCPDNSCQFCGPLDSVLLHITDVHSMIIQNFSYGEVIRIPLHLVGKYVVLRADDGTAFVLWVDDQSDGKMMSIFCAEQPSFCRTRFTFELTYDLPPVVRSWLGRQDWTPLYYASKPRVKPWDTFGSSIVKYEKNQDVSGIANADSRIIRRHILSSNLGYMHVDFKSCALRVPRTFHASYCGPKMWYGDIIFSISNPSDTN